MATDKYQIELRTSNLPGLVYTGEMDPNEGGGSLLTNSFNSSLAQLVEQHLDTVKVTSSNLVGTTKTSLVWP